MLLIVQIALGIALGYALIFHHHLLLQYGRKASKFLLALVAFAAVSFSALLAYEKISQELSRASSPMHQEGSQIAEFRTSNGDLVEVYIPGNFNYEQRVAWEKGVASGILEMELRAIRSAKQAAASTAGVKEAPNPADIVWDDNKTDLKPWERDWGGAETPKPVQQD